MPKKFIIVLSLAFILPSCSPRDFLTHRLAADLIAGSNVFRSQQSFQFNTGVVSNTDYVSSRYLILQHRGWISGNKAPCPPGLAPPCWNLTLTPSGVDAFQSLVSPAEAQTQSFNLLAAKRELVVINGIAKQGDIADVEFTWKWIPLNEIGAAIYPGDLHYRSTARFRFYDDGWRLVEHVPRPVQSLEDELRDAEPVR